MSRRYYDVESIVTGMERDGNLDPTEYDEAYDLCRYVDHVFGLIDGGEPEAAPDSESLRGSIGAMFPAFVDTEIPALIIEECRVANFWSWRNANPHLRSALYGRDSL